MSNGILPSGNINQVVDYSSSLVNIPNQWYFYEALGLFNDDYKTQSKVGVPIYDEVLSLAVDKNWEDRAPSLKRSVRRVLNFDIPRNPLRESITPRDTAGIVSFEDWTKGDGIVLETVNRLRNEKLTRLKNALRYTKEVARNQLITTGTVYAPSGTLAQSYDSSASAGYQTIDWFQEFGVTQTVITTALASSNVDPSQYWEAVIAAVQDGLLTGSFYSDLICICSPTYFNALITNDFYVDNAKQNQVIGSARLEKRLTAMGLPLDIRYRSIEINGITFIEHRGKKPDGTAFIPTDKAFVVPLGVQDMFTTVYAPALGRFEYQNTVAQDMYVWEFINVSDETQEISFVAESNFVNACMRPQAIIKLSLT